MRVACFAGLIVALAAAKPQEVNILVEGPSADVAEQLTSLMQNERARTAHLESLVSAKASFVQSAPVSGTDMKNRLFTTEEMRPASLSVNIVESANEPVSATMGNALLQGETEGHGPWKRFVIPAHHGFQASEPSQTVFNVHIPEGASSEGIVQDQLRILAALKDRSHRIAAMYGKASFVAQPARIGGDASRLVGEAVDIANHVISVPEGQGAAAPSDDILNKAQAASADARAGATAMRSSFLAVRNPQYQRETQSPMVWLNLRGGRGSFVQTKADPSSTVDIYLEEGPSA